MALAALIFDLDGTLWDTSEACAVAWNRVARRHGINFRQVTADDVRSVAGQPHGDCIRTIFRGVSEEHIAILIAGTETEDNIAVEELGGHLYEGVAEGLQTLAEKFPLFIVSNCQSGYIETFLQKTNLSPFFTDFECWGNTGRPKTENLRQIIERNRIMEACYVGDTCGDEEAAEGNSIPFWFVTYGFGRAEAPALTFASFPSLVAHACRHVKKTRLPHKLVRRGACANKVMTL